MKIKYSFTYILAVMLFVAVSVTSIALYMVNRTTVNDTQFTLKELLKRRVAIIKTIYNQTHNKDSVIHFFYKWNENIEGVNQSKEFVVTEEHNDSLYFLIDQRDFDYVNTHPLYTKSAKASPSKKAVSGLSGFTEGPDYRGVEVYAVYTYIPELKWGAVSKIDVDEVRKPLIHNFIIILILSIIAAIIGATLYYKIHRSINSVLKESERNLATTLQSIGDGFISTDKDGMIVNMNRVAENMCDWKITEAKGKSLVEVFKIKNADTRETVENPVKEVLENGKVVGLANHTLLISKDGTEYQIADSAAPIINDNGEITGVVLIFSDYTEKYNSQKRILESEDRFQLLFNQAPLGYQSLDIEGNFIEVNQKWLDTLGYTKNEVIGKWFGDFLSPIYQEGFRNRFPLFKERGSIHSEFEMLHKNGDKLFIAFEGKVGYNVDGEFKQTHCILQDITEKRKSEEALRSREAQYKLLFKSIPAPTYAWQKSGDDMILVDYNDRAFSFTHGKVAEILGIKASEFYKDNVNIIEDLNQCINFKILIEKEIDYNFKLTNESKYLNTKYVFVSPDFVIVHTEDITERKLAEKKLYISEARYRRLFESAKEGILILDAETGMIVDANPYLLEMLGYPLESFIKKAIWEIGFFKDIVANKDNFLELQQNEYIRYEDMPLETAYGKTIDVEFISNVFLVDNIKVIQCNIRNITERIQSVKALHESEETYKMLFDSINDAIFISELTDDGKSSKFIAVNNIACQRLGYTKEELLTKTSSDINSERMKPNLTFMMRDIFENKFAIIETEHQTKDGLIIPVEISTNVTQLNNKTIFHSIARDITKRKKAEIELKKNENFLKETQQIAKLGSYSLNIKTGTWISSEILDTIFGIDKDYNRNVEGWVNIIHPEWQQMMNDYFINEVLGTKTNFNKEYKIIKQDDRTEHWVHGLGTLKFDKNGDTIEMIGTIRDISELKQEELYRELSSDVLQILNKSDSTKYSILRIVIIFKNITGFDAVGIRLKNGNDYPYYAQKGFSKEFLSTENTLLNCNSNRSKCNDNDENSCLECMCGLVIAGKTDPKSSHFTRGGSFITNNSYPILDIPINEDPRHNPRNVCIYEGYASIALVPIRQHKEIVGLIHLCDKYNDRFTPTTIEILESIASNIGESLIRNQAELELIKAKEQAEESDRLKSAFLANMSHEIRTPMNGILGFAELLKEPELSGEQQQKYINIIQKSGDRMLNTINDIIDISRIEAGLMEILTEETNINEQIEYIHIFFKQEAEQKGLQLIIKNELSPNDAIINTDKEKVYGVLTNLIKNAIKFTDEGSIVLGCSSTSSPSGQTVLEFYVKDTGIGIPIERQEAIFERFIKADVENKRAFQGSGLGLSISKAYIEMLGGNIWLKSEEGKGTKFYFSLPIHKKIEELKFNNIEDASPKIAESQVIKKLKILIVEDDEVSDELITHILNKNEHEILHAINGKEAIEICKKNPDIDLILMDINMSVMDGYETTQQIRQFNKGVIIVAQTAFALKGDRDEAIAAGCNDYISKPINQEKLNSVIKDYFGE